MKKALVISFVASMIDQFNMSNILILQELGYDVTVACNFIKGNTCSDDRIKILKDKLERNSVKTYQIDFERNQG